MLEAGEKGKASIVSSQDHIPLLLQHLHSLQDQPLLVWRLSWSRQEVQQGSVDAAVKGTHCFFPLTSGLLNGLTTAGGLTNYRLGLLS